MAWTPLALSDRDKIFDLISAENPRTAIAVDEAIATHISQLGEFPEAGAPGRVEGTWEQAIKQTPFVAVFRVTEDDIDVLRILHGARRLPDDR